MSLKSRLSQPKILTAPGVYDALTAALAADAGFEALYLSGAAVAYTRLGRPDIGLTTASEMVDTMALIRDRVDLPVIIDADTGFGNALNAQRTMRTYERAGASALQIEDQSYPKRCGHLTGKSLIPATEMAGKVKVVKVDVDSNPNTAAQLGVRGIPALFVFKDGDVVSNRAGAAPKAALQSWIQDSI